MKNTALNLTLLKDLLAEPEETTNYLVEALLPAGGLSLLAAKPKTGKSTLARQLALAVARGDEFLGKKTETGLVIYLAFEERRADVRNHFLKMGATGEENLKIFAGMAPADGLTQLRRTAESEKPSLIIVDTLARLARIKDMNDYSQTTLGLEPFLALAREVGTHVLLLHHAKKGDGRGIDSILGSTGLSGSVDTIINLHRTEEYRTISTIQRDGNDLADTVLQFNKETQITTLGGSREDAEVGSLKGEILHFLAGQESFVLEKSIEDGVEGRTGHKRKALRELVHEGKVEREGKGGRGSPYLYRHNDSCSLVPDRYVEQENKHAKDKGKWAGAAL